MWRWPSSRPAIILYYNVNRKVRAKEYDIVVTMSKQRWRPGGKNGELENGELGKWGWGVGRHTDATDRTKKIKLVLQRDAVSEGVAMREVVKMDRKASSHGGEAVSEGEDRLARNQLKGSWGTSQRCQYDQAKQRAARQG